nr:MAG TPA: hypothetical protein [Caudoviricetes sp.]
MSWRRISSAISSSLGGLSTTALRSGWRALSLASLNRGPIARPIRIGSGASQSTSKPIKPTCS